VFFVWHLVLMVDGRGPAAHLNLVLTVTVFCLVCSRAEDLRTTFLCFAGFGSREVRDIFMGQNTSACCNRQQLHVLACLALASAAHHDSAQHGTAWHAQQA
jgi:hypothetical protein